MNKFYCMLSLWRGSPKHTWGMHEKIIFSKEHLQFKFRLEEIIEQNIQ